MSWLGGTWPLTFSVVAFVLAAVVIVLAGSRLAKTVDRLADETGLGEALAGAVLLAAATSLSGLAVSITSAVQGDPSLAVSNSAGGIAAQTLFIVVADVMHRRSNLEHAAASLTNMFSAFLVVALLAVIQLGVAAPGWDVWAVHPVTVLIVFTYLGGLRISQHVTDEPMWKPHLTEETRTEGRSAQQGGGAPPQRWAAFAGLAAVILAAGWVVARSGQGIVAATGLSATFVGSFFTGVATSLPELVTTITAVKAGALTLAVAGILGSNSFDTLFVAFADVAYRDGAVYEALTDQDMFALAWAILLGALIGAGLIRRERGGIGFEGVAVAVCYIGGLVALALQ